MHVDFVLTKYFEILYWSFSIKTKSICNTYEYCKILYCIKTKINRSMHNNFVLMKGLTNNA